MWPWHPWWLWWHMPLTSDKQQCAHAHKRALAAAKDLDVSHREHAQSTKEARHSTRNIRMLMQALHYRLVRHNEE